MTKFYKVTMRQRKEVDGDGGRIYFNFATKGTAIEVDDDGNETIVDVYWSVTSPDSYRKQDHPDIIKVEETTLDEIKEYHPQNKHVMKLLAAQ